MSKTIQTMLLDHPDFPEAIFALYKHKKRRKVYTKAAEELAELSVRLLQAVNKGVDDNMIAEELVDVQMHLILLQLYFTDILPLHVHEKMEKFLQSNDAKRYRSKAIDNDRPIQS
jgi:NTP pyrophosphatase (non-canonical NTP hydrolase)